MREGKVVALVVYPLDVPTPPHLTSRARRVCEKRPRRGGRAASVREALPVDARRPSTRPFLRSRANILASNAQAGLVCGPLNALD